MSINHTDLNHSKQLYDAGFPQGDSSWKWILYQEIDGSRQEWRLCHRHLNCWWYVGDESQFPCMFVDSNVKSILDAVTAEQLLNELRKMHPDGMILEYVDRLWKCKFNGHIVSRQIDLFDALVEAYVYANKIKQESECPSTPIASH